MKEYDLNCDSARSGLLCQYPLGQYPLGQHPLGQHPRLGKIRPAVSTSTGFGLPVPRFGLPNQYRL